MMSNASPLRMFLVIATRQASSVTATCRRRRTDGPARRTCGFGSALRACSARRRSSRRRDFQVDRRTGNDRHAFRRSVRQAERRRWRRSRRVWRRRRSSSVRRKTCGVCASHKSARGRRFLRSCDRRATRFSVPETGIARIAASGLFGRLEDLVIHSSAMHGRAASWTATKSMSGFTRARAFSTESARSAPPSTTSMPENRDVRGEFEMEVLAVLGRDDQRAFASRHRGPGTARPSAATRPDPPAARTASCSSYP